MTPMPDMDNLVLLGENEEIEKDGEFDVYRWIDEQLLAGLRGMNSQVGINTQTQAEAPAKTDSDKIEQLSSRLLASLQAKNTQLSAKMESISDQVVKNLPRILYDVEQIRREIGLIRVDIEEAVVQSEVGLMNDTPKSVSSDTSPKETKEKDNAKPQEVIKHLIELDAMKSKMEATRAALKETENWNSLQSEMEGIFVSKDYERAASRLEEAKRSLVLLKNAEEVNERTKLLQSLKERLEKEVTPSIMDALLKKDTGVIQRLYRVLELIDRVDAFKTLYLDSWVPSLQSFWETFDNVNDRSDAASWFGDFYDYALQMLRKEESFLSSLLAGDTLKTDSDAFLQHVFVSLKPSFGDRLRNLVPISPSSSSSASSSSTSTNNLPTLVQIYTKTMQFITQSNSRSFFETLLGDFAPYMTEYGQLEEKNLSARLSTTIDPILSTITKDPELCVKELTATIPKLLATIDTSITRCKELTHWFGVAGLITSMDTFFSSLMNQLLLIVGSLRSVTGIDTVETPTSAKEKPQDEFGSVTEQEWRGVQIALRVANCGVAIEKKVVLLENQVKEIITKVKVLLDDYSKVEEGVQNEMVIKYWKKQLQLPDNSKRLQDVRQLIDRVSNTSDTTQPILPRTHENMQSFIPICIRFVFDSLFLPISKPLSSLPTITPTTEQTTSYGMELPKFSLGPRSYITQIGETILTLPSTLEMWGDEEALSWHMDMIPYYVAPAQSAHEGHDTTGEEEEPHILHIWMTCLANGTQQLLTSNLMKRLNRDGDKVTQQERDQVVADLGYLVNVLGALDVDVDVTERCLEMWEKSGNDAGNSGVGEGARMDNTDQEKNSGQV